MSAEMLFSLPIFVIMKWVIKWIKKKSCLNEKICGLNNMITVLQVLILLQYVSKTEKEYFLISSNHRR